MIFGSVCSGIEAASVALAPIGWKAAWLAEIEKFPSEVLAHHYPDTPNLGDMTKLAAMVLSGEIEAPEALIGGTPCQAFSVAGAREGLADERGLLTIKFGELADAIDHVRERKGKPATIVKWENVPGVLSDKSNAFGCFLGLLAGEDSELQPPGRKWANAGFVLGPKRTIAWRVLDAQFFGLAQRRRRVFVVASARKDFDPRAVLFEFEGVRRDFAPSRETGEEVAALTANGVGTCGAEDNQAQAGHLITVNTLTQRPYADRGDGDIEKIVCMSTGQASAEIGIGTTLNCNHEAPIVTTQYGEIAGTLTARHDSSACADRGQNVVCFEPGILKREGNKNRINNEICPTLRAEMGDNRPAVAFAQNSRDELREMDISGCLSAQAGMKQTSYVRDAMIVRRLTPVECERLQGFPDNYTRIKWGRYAVEDCPDGHRYKALGNSMAVPVMRWIGQRINNELSRRGTNA